jgi:large repetitive protein
MAGALDATLACNDVAGIAAAQAMFPVANDNCDNDVSDIVKVAGDFVPSMSCPQEGTYTNTWTVTDACGNVSAIYTQVITITDNAAPIWVTPPGFLDVVLACHDAAGIANALAAFPEASDLCDMDVTDIIKTSGDFIPSVCPESGSYTHTWIVLDDCGNASDIYTQVITIYDDEAPNWITPEGSMDVTLQCDDLAGLIEAQLDFPLADDNCDGDVTAIVKSSGPFVEVPVPIRIPGW